MMVLAGSKISVIIPTMNEEGSIGLVIDEVKKSLEGRRPYEIVVVDTDSTDKTREIASSMGALVVEEPRRGYGRAYKSGFERSSGDLIATLDADMTYPAYEIPALADKVESGDLDFITTDRFARMEKGAMSRKHRLGNKVLSVTARVLFRAKIRDSQSGMWVFRKGILNKLELRSDGMSFSEEIKLEAFVKCRAKEVPISYRIRIGEVKLDSWSDGLGNLRYLFRKRFRR